LGYSNIKIYNGGIKDWKKAGLPLNQVKPLPEASVRWLTAEQLLHRLQATEASQCYDQQGRPLLSLLDLRNENLLSPETPPVRLVTACPVLTLELDDLLTAEARARVPREIPVVTITETGNRDVFVLRYLSQFGFDNLEGLEYGMRSWIKAGYPVRE
jgi:rhodanese-related sulfurtransferase